MQWNIIGDTYLLTCTHTHTLSLSVMQLSQSSGSKDSLNFTSPTVPRLTLPAYISMDSLEADKHHATGVITSLASPPPLPAMTGPSLIPPSPGPPPSSPATLQIAGTTPTLPLTNDHRATTPDPSTLLPSGSTPATSSSTTDHGSKPPPISSTSTNTKAGTPPEIPSSPSTAQGDSRQQQDTTHTAATTQTRRHRSVSLNLHIDQCDIVTSQQAQLNTACTTIQSMQHEIKELKLQLATTRKDLHTLQQTFEVLENTCAGIKNTMKVNTKDTSEKLQELRNEQTKLQGQTKDTGNTLQSLKDSQNTIKKQLQTTITTKKMHTGSQTDQTNNASTAEDENNTYAVPTYNSFAPLAGAPENTHTHSSSTCKANSDKGRNTYPTHISKQTNAQKSQDTLRPSHTNQQTSRISGNQQDNPVAVLNKQMIPGDCQTLILGDSALEGMKDSSMTEHFICVPGISVNNLSQWLSSSPPSPHIQHVTFHVGIDSCKEKIVSVDEWRHMLKALIRVFPQANIKMSSIIPPYGNHPLRHSASESTTSLHHACKSEKVGFIDNTPGFLTKSGAPKRSMYKGGLTISRLAIRVLAEKLCPTQEKKRPPLLPTPHIPSVNNYEAPGTADYDHTFPPTKSYHPNSSKVYNSLGRHQSPHSLLQKSTKPPAPHSNPPPKHHVPFQGQYRASQQPHSLPVQYLSSRTAGLLPHPPTPTISPTLAPPYLISSPHPNPRQSLHSTSHHFSRTQLAPPSPPLPPQYHHFSPAQQPNRLVHLIAELIQQSLPYA